MKILILSLGGVLGASRREHVEHVEHMNGIIDEDQTKELRVSYHQRLTKKELLVPCRDRTRYQREFRTLNKSFINRISGNGTGQSQSIH